MLLPCRCGLFDAAAFAVPAAACASLSRDFRDKDGGAALNMTLPLRCTSAAMSVGAVHATDTLALQFEQRRRARWPSHSC